MSTTKIKKPVKLITGQKDIKMYKCLMTLGHSEIINNFIFLVLL